MSRIVQVGGSLVCLAILIHFVAQAPAQQPDATAEQRIRAALDGDLATGESADGMLEDVLGVIRQRGSILDGSSLDSTIQRDEPDIADRGSQTRKALAAEQLLKAARLLEAVPSQDRPDTANGGDLSDNRHSLVRRMRAEAAVLLSE